jgi:hypothetical protein
VLSAPETHEPVLSFVNRDFPKKGGATPSASSPVLRLFYPVPGIVASRKILKVVIPGQEATNLQKSRRNLADRLSKLQKNEVPRSKADVVSNLWGVSNTRSS